MTRYPISLLAAFALTVSGIAGCDLLTSPETRIERADANLAAGEYRAAVFELRKVLEDDPDNGRARMLLAEAEFGSGEIEAAEADLDRALAAGVAPAEAARLKARLQLAFGRFQVLLTQLDAGEIALDGEELQVFRGRALLGLRQTAEATEAFETALRLAPGSADARLGIAEARAQAGSVSGALTDLAAITSEDPAAARAWLARGSLLLQLGRYEESNDALAQALEHAKGRLGESQQLQAIAGQVDAQVAMNQLDDATARLAELERRAPRAPLTRLLQARIAIARGDLAEAVKGLTELTNNLPDFLPARFMLGSVLLAQGNLYQAERQFSVVVERDPGNIEGRKRLAEVRLRMNRPEAAMDLLGAAIGEGTVDARAVALLGAAQLSAGADPSAIRRLEQVVERNPENRSARLDLAGLYITAGDAARAVDLLQSMPSSKEDARREFLLIRALVAMSGEGPARAEVDRLVGNSGTDIERMNLAAGFYLSFGDVAAATKTLEKALAIEPGHVPTLVNLGRARLAAERLDEAEALLRRALSHDPASVDARVGMAEIAGRRKRNDEAIRWLEEIRVDDARAVASRLLLARLYLSGKESAKAAKVLTEALAAAPNRADVLIAAGELQQDFGQHEQALGYYRKATDLEPLQPEHWLHTARAQAALGFQPAARESVERALGLAPDSADAVAFAARLDLTDGKNAEALERTLALRRRQPRDAVAALLEGDVRSALGQHREAARAYGESVSMQRSLPAVIRLSQARQLAGTADALAPLRDWLGDKPDDIAARGMYGIFLDQAGRADDAIAQYERVLEVGRPDPVMSNNLAMLYLGKGDPRAEALARQAYQLAPTNGAIADTLGWILVKKGSKDEGLRLLREAVAQAPQEPEIQLHLAEALVGVGQRAEARQLLEKLLGANAEFDGRQRALELLKSAGG
jgi:putative PEP-CTERM system TPR-repeat lipoprotein